MCLCAEQMQIIILNPVYYSCESDQKNWCIVDNASGSGGERGAGLKSRQSPCHIKDFSLFLLCLAMEAKS